MSSSSVAARRCSQSSAAASQVTTEEDLEIIFSRFGTITSCDIIRDYKTGAAAELPTEALPTCYLDSIPLGWRI